MSEGFGDQYWLDHVKKEYERHRIDYNLFFTIILGSLVLKSLSYFMFTTFIGDPYHITQDTLLAKIFKISLLRSPDSTIPTDGYDDIWYHYIPYVEAFSRGWNPYSDTGLPRDAVSGNYNYGPLYLIFISFGTVFLGMDPFYSIVLSNILFDSVNCGLVYVIFRHFYKKRASFIISVFYSVSPVMIYYVDVKLLNLPQMTFFTLIFIISFLRENDDFMAMSLAMGFVTKFIPAFFLIPMVIYWWKKLSFEGALRLLGIFTLYSAAICLPYFIDDPRGFIDQFLKAGIRSGSDIGIFQLIYQNLRPNLPFFLGVGITIFLILRYQEQLLHEKVLFLRLLVFYMLFAVHGSFYGLYSRGFKYYHGYLMSFYLILFFVTHEGKWSVNQKLVIGGVLTYITNVLIFSLPTNIGSFHHRRVLMIYMPSLVLFWLFYDLRKLSKIEAEKDQNMTDEEGERVEY